MSGRHPPTIDAYLEGLPEEQRQALERLRRVLREAVPEAEEGWSYSMPALFLNGRALVCYSAFKNHCSFFPMSGKLVEVYKKELKGFATSKGTIQFTPEKPLPVTLIRKLVQARIQEMGTKGQKARKDGGATKKKVVPAKKSSRQGGSKRTAGSSSAEVDQFLRALDHPLKADIESVRQMILAVSPEIQEGIKWNAPSFRAKDDFATFFLRPRQAVQLIFHLGAKKRDKAVAIQMEDPDNLIQWLATDRCLVNLGSGKEIKQKRAALEEIVKTWMKYVS